MPYKFNVDRRHKIPKARYRVTNWPEYDAALVRRGSLTVWVTEEAVAAWHAPATGKRGAQLVYSDIAIETGLALRLVLHQPLRQIEGALRSIADLLGVDIRIPDHTTFSRRGAGLKILPKRIVRDESLHLLVDSTGIKINGEVELTTDDVGDVLTIPDLLDQIEGAVSSMTGDGAYDGQGVYDAVAERHPGAIVIIPPRSTAVPSETAATQRDQHLATIAVHGRIGWQRSSGYSRRSLVETAMYRYKTIIGRLHARTLPTQRIEAKIGCNVLNRMTNLGMTVSVCIK